jgi:hypothetical protein
MKSKPVTPVKSTNEKGSVKAKVSDVMKKINHNLQAIKEIQFCNVQIATNKH